MASLFSRSTQFISTPKLTSTQSQKLSSPPSSVAFRQSQRISVSYSATAERPTNVSHTFSTASSSMYEVLGIDMLATSQKIKAAYRRLARLLHPDVASKNCSSAADEFIKVHNAYSTLSDPIKRAEYDRSLFPRERRMASVIRSSTTDSRYAGYWTGRDWETDQCW